MCRHMRIKQGNVCICVKCGLMVTDDGKFIGFDKELPNYIRNKKEVKKK